MLPTPPILAALAQRTALVDDTKALLAGFVPRLADVEREIADVQAELTTAVLSTNDEPQRRDLELLVNRATSALRTSRQISAEVLDLAKLVGALVRDAQSAAERAAPKEAS